MKKGFIFSTVGAAILVALALCVLLLSGCIEKDAKFNENITAVYYQGVQCYPSSGVVADKSYYLEEYEIEVIDISSENMMVCQACGCPESTRYTATIYEENLEEMIALGWHAK